MVDEIPKLRTKPPSEMQSDMRSRPKRKRKRTQDPRRRRLSSVETTDVPCTIAAQRLPMLMTFAEEKKKVEDEMRVVVIAAEAVVGGYAV